MLKGISKNLGFVWFFSIGSTLIVLNSGADGLAKVLFLWLALLSAFSAIVVLVRTVGAVREARSRDKGDRRPDAF